MKRETGDELRVDLHSLVSNRVGLLLVALTYRTRRESVQRRSNDNTGHFSPRQPRKFRVVRRSISFESFRRSEAEHLALVSVDSPARDDDVRRFVESIVDDSEMESRQSRISSRWNLSRRADQTSTCSLYHQA